MRAARSLVLLLLLVVVCVGSGAAGVLLPMGALVLYLDSTAREADAGQSALTEERREAQRETQVLAEDLQVLGEEMEASLEREHQLQGELRALRGRLSKSELTQDEIEAQLASLQDQLSESQQALSSVQDQVVQTQRKLHFSTRKLAGYEAFDKVVPDAKMLACPSRLGQRQCEEGVVSTLLQHKAEFLECASLGDLPWVVTLGERIPDHYVLLGKGESSAVALAMCDRTLPDQP